MNPIDINTLLQAHANSSMGLGGLGSNVSAGTTVAQYQNHMAEQARLKQLQLQAQNMQNGQITGPAIVSAIEKLSAYVNKLIENNNSMQEDISRAYNEINLLKSSPNKGYMGGNNPSPMFTDLTEDSYQGEPMFTHNKITIEAKQDSIYPVETRVKIESEIVPESLEVQFDDSVLIADSVRDVELPKVEATIVKRKTVKVVKVKINSDRAKLTNLPIAETLNTSSQKLPLNICKAMQEVTSLEELNWLETFNRTLTNMFNRLIKFNVGDFSIDSYAVDYNTLVSSLGEMEGQEEFLEVITTKWDKVLKSFIPETIGYHIDEHKVAIDEWNTEFGNLPAEKREPKPKFEMGVVDDMYVALTQFNSSFLGLDDITSYDNFTELEIDPRGHELMSYIERSLYDHPEVSEFVIMTSDKQFYQVYKDLSNNFHIKRYTDNTQ